MIFDETRKYDVQNPASKIGVTVVAARYFFMHFFRQGVLTELTIKKIEENFIASMMTVRDEGSNRQKYDYLNFVEFEELLCRLCIVGFDPEQYPESIAWRV